MRRTAALIVGGGPAGAAAAIRLARSGLAPLVIERSTGPHDVVCGGFLGWDALTALRRLGLDPAELNAHPIHRLRLVSPTGSVETVLPHPAAGLSRRILDAALLATAQDAGAEVLRGRTARAVEGTTLRLDDGEEIAGESLMLATGKHELRGVERAAGIAGAPLGLRTALVPGPSLVRAISGVIELHLFDGGYAGLLLQEDGRANLCLSVSRARFKAAGGIEQLVAALADELPALADRLDASEAGEWSAIAGIPYGWRARTTAPGLYRLGDQAAVIASLAGDGIAIALSSGCSAAQALLSGTDAATWQRGFDRRSARPILIAESLRRAAENARARRPLMALLGRLPILARLGARLTRIGD